jgi:VWFA-related protein
VSPARIRPEQVRRTIALIVDDLGLSVESIGPVKDALKKYVGEQLLPGDLVAIIRTSGETGSLQQFTVDKDRLYAAIERVRFQIGRGGLSAIEPISFDPASKLPKSNLTDMSPEFRNQFFTIGTLGKLETIVRGLANFPGRKSVVLFSEGFSINDKDQRIKSYLRRLTDLSNRSSVVLYTVDARGFSTLELSAADSVGEAKQSEIIESLEGRRTQFVISQEGLRYLAAQTGGMFLASNDLNSRIKRVLDDQNGFYLIGYDPDESSFKDVKGERPFHKLEVKVKRSGLRVRSRTGFLGRTDAEVRPPVPRTRAEQLKFALTSPFSPADLPLRLTTSYIQDDQKGALLRSLLHIEAQKLTFTNEADGWHKADIDVAAALFGDNGDIVELVNRTQTIRARDEIYNRILQEGFVYIFDIPAQKAGAYQLRVAMRDSASQRIGSASQFLTVPNAKENQFTLSGIFLGRGEPASMEQATERPDETGSQALVPAVRKFKRGTVLEYLYHIYNAQLDRTNNRPQLKAQARLFYKNQEVFANKETPVDLSGQTNPKKVIFSGRLQLGTEMAPGEYILQVIVADEVARKKENTMTQSIDFEVVE